MKGCWQVVAAAAVALGSWTAQADPPPGPGLRFSAYQPKDGTYRGSIHGVVRLAVPAAKLPPVKHTRDPSVCGEEAADDSLLLDEQGGVANAVVLLDIAQGRRPEPRSDAVLDQKGCSYVPRIQAVPVGSTLALTNSDPLLHTVHAWSSGLSVFNKAEPLKGDRKVVDLKKAGLVTIKCDIHGWMQAYIVVSPHPYFAVTDAHGAYSLAGVPQGEYSVQVWHERLGVQEAKVTVGVEGAATADLSYATAR